MCRGASGSPICYSSARGTGDPLPVPVGVKCPLKMTVGAPHVFCFPQILTTRLRAPRPLPIPEPPPAFFFSRLRRIRTAARSAMIKGIVIVNNNGYARLVKLFTKTDFKKTQSAIREIYTLVSRRSGKLCNFVDKHTISFFGDDTRLIYRHYATLYFVFACDKSGERTRHPRPDPGLRRDARQVLRKRLRARPHISQRKGPLHPRRDRHGRHGSGDQHQPRAQGRARDAEATGARDGARSGRGREAERLDAPKRWPRSTPSQALPRTAPAPQTLARSGRARAASATGRTSRARA